MCIVCEKNIPDDIETLKCCEKVEKIPFLPSLESLDCSSCKVEEIPFLPSLESLDCSNCEKVKEVPFLPKLKYLRCSNCLNLSFISPELTSLVLINCQYCPKIVSLSKFENLTFLCCYFCVNLENISDIPKCTHLYTYGCKKLTKLPYCPNLKIPKPDVDVFIQRPVAQCNKITDTVIATFPGVVDTISNKKKQRVIETSYEEASNKSGEPEWLIRAQCNSYAVGSTLGNYKWKFV